MKMKIKFVILRINNCVQYKSTRNDDTTGKYNALKRFETTELIFNTQMNVTMG